MDLWIRSQAGEMLFKAEDFKLIGSNGSRCIIYCNEHTVAMYNTKERAEEVLGEIHQRLIDIQVMKAMPDVYITINKVGRNIDCVYQMPKE